MRIRRQIRIGISLFLVLGVLAFLGLRSKPNVIELPDGRTFEVAGTTVGTEPFSSAKSWEKLAIRILPESLHQWLPKASTHLGSSITNSITVYFRVTVPTGAPLAGRLLDFVQAEDSGGFRFVPEGSHFGFGTSPSSMYAGVTLTAYPRRQREFRLHLLKSGGGEFGTITVPTPINPSFEEWRPLPLPQNVTNGAVEVTLKTVRLVGPRASREIIPEWKLNSSPSHWQNASALPLTLFDASGNESILLSTNEQAWKLRLKLRRHLDSELQHYERCQFRDVFPPAPGHFTALNKTTKLLNVTTTVHLVSGTGEIFVTNGFNLPLTTKPGSGISVIRNGTNTLMSWRSKKPFVLVDAENVQPDDTLYVYVVDEKGEKLNAGDLSPVYRMSDGSQFVRRIGFNPKPETKSVTVEILLNRPLVFDFLVDPKDIQITEGTPKP